MQKPIKTRRLVLRALKDSDVPQLTRLAGDWDVARMTARIPYPYSEAMAREWLASLAPGEFVRAVTFGGTLVGAVGYVPNDDGSAEIGYWIGRPWWGRGFASEAARALVRYCFTTAGFKRLTCCHFEDNLASARVVRKLGFRAKGVVETWSDARQGEYPARTYERARPLRAVLWRITA
ncbi:GNAT family N-acetyltransferase [Hyphomicrobium sp. CS1GBMeth3]|uniref:GNAT family N-acetyltransferase n=1 Tax=Hyphomicrobium sp. CS1GBMeth3 TaxID=1892845 RepID=UPI0009311E8D|nr:GNAT family N-acetyltransferase [Hyphomicrobium sp. CS1GBMeth3]